MAQDQHEMTDEIIRLTMLMKTKYPELYAHLYETPLLASHDLLVDNDDLEDYRNTLLEQIKDAESIILLRNE